jgi:N-acetylglucosamine-6-sulfatase
MMKHALRGARYKYIHVHGLWDIDELYDLETDPFETTNLIFSEAHRAIVKQMNERLFATLRQSAGLYIPLYPDRGGVSRLRRNGGAPQADFPPQFVREKGQTNQQRE